jgi:hypothetical protein
VNDKLLSCQNEFEINLLTIKILGEIDDKNVAKLAFPMLKEFLLTSWKQRYTFDEFKNLLFNNKFQVMRAKIEDFGPEIKEFSRERRKLWQYFFDQTQNEAMQTVKERVKNFS